MQLRKFYGRTVAGTLARVKQELGEEALILETRTIDPKSATARMEPGAKIEILAAAPGATAPAAAESAEAATPRSALLQDLGQMRSQIRALLDGQGAASAEAAGLDVADYHGLIAEGVDHQALAPHFREWLAWRTAPAALRKYLAQAEGSAAGKMQGASLREWLWHSWLQADVILPGFGARLTLGRDLEVVGLVGATGGGKTTTLAKLASIIRRERHKNVAIVTLDTQRFGATEQWRRIGKLMGIEVFEVATPKDATECVESWSRFDWVGIDTPGGMTADSAAGRLYGSLLAQCSLAKTAVVLPLTHQDQVSRNQMQRAKQWGAQDLVFTKLDEAAQRGSVYNLTAGGAARVAGFSAGTRVPEDYETATAQTLWTNVLAPAGAPFGEGAAA
jgi:flagellar biosynthesis protein FlhF